MHNYSLHQRQLQVIKEKPVKKIFIKKIQKTNQKKVAQQLSTKYEIQK